MKRLFLFMVPVMAMLALGCIFAGATLSKIDKVRMVRTAPVHVAEADATATVNSRKIKLALLLDTSNSMDGLIDQAKSQLWSVVNELSAATHADSTRPELEISLYEYGNDNISASTGYIRQVLPFTTDLDEVSEKLFQLSTRGGSEYCGHVIQTSLNDLAWSADQDDLQLIFIAGNEPFNQGDVPYREASLNAKSKFITVNTIFCGDYELGINTLWKDGADLTGGTYMNIDHNQKTVYVASPYDDQINQLNIQLNQTYIGYGSYGREKKVKQEEQDKNANSYGSANNVKRTVSKTSHLYKNSSWDLVDASEEKGFDLTKIKDEDLPKEMRGLSLEQKQKYIEQKKAEREQVKSRVKELNKQREEYVAKEKTKTESGVSLDDAMLKSVKEQAKQKQYTFSK